MKRFSFIVLIALTVSACSTREPIPAHGPAPAPGYVSVDMCGFAIDGEPWFPLMLNYKAFYSDGAIIPAPWYTGSDIRTHFDTIAAWGFNAVRVCLDHLPANGDTASMYAATRRMVLQADSAGLRVMLLIVPPLDDHWRQYAIGLLRTLADMPALWAYDLMNEPLYFDPEPRRDKLSAVSIVSGWRDMVRQYAPHQLFTVATAEPIEVFEWDPSMLPIDFIEMHTYHPLRVASEMYWYSHYCGKPWMVGETGLPADGDSVPYDAQALFMRDTYIQAVLACSCGYGWWEFQDYPEGVNFEAQYTGLRDGGGRRKPAAAAVRLLRTIGLDSVDCQRPANYYNNAAFNNIAIEGSVSDPHGRPLEGAVVRGWNEDWSIGVNTYSDADGCFRLVCNDLCVHFEISAPGYSNAKFDRRLTIPEGTPMPDRHTEYLNVSLVGWGDSQSLLPVDSARFAAANAVRIGLGDVVLEKLKLPSSSCRGRSAVQQ